MASCAHSPSVVPHRNHRYDATNRALTRPRKSLNSERERLGRSRGVRCGLRSPHSLQISRRLWRATSKGHRKWTSICRVRPTTKGPAAALAAELLPTPNRESGMAVARPNVSAQDEGIARQETTPPRCLMDCGPRNFRSTEAKRRRSQLPDCPPRSVLQGSPTTCARGERLHLATSANAMPLDRTRWRRKSKSSAMFALTRQVQLVRWPSRPLATSMRAEGKLASSSAESPGRTRARSHAMDAGRFEHGAPA